MGLGCSKQSQSDGEEGSSRDVVRLSPFRPRRCSLRRRSGAPTAGAAGEPGSLLSLAADALAASLHQQAPTALACLPADLSQLLLERLVAQVRRDWWPPRQQRRTGAWVARLTGRPALVAPRLLHSTQGRLDDAAIAALDGAGLLFYGLPLGGYPELVRPAWLACLTSASLEAADLSKTGVRDGRGAGGSRRRRGRRPQLCRRVSRPTAPCPDPSQVTDAGLAALGAPPRLARLRLDFCVDLTDAGLASLQGAHRRGAVRGRPAVCAWMRPSVPLRWLRCGPSAAALHPRRAGLTALEELSLTGCEQLTPLGLQWLGGLARLRRLSLQTCHHVWCGACRGRPRAWQGQLAPPRRPAHAWQRSLVTPTCKRCVPSATLPPAAASLSWPTCSGWRRWTSGGAAP